MWFFFTFFVMQKLNSFHSSGFLKEDHFFKILNYLPLLRATPPTVYGFMRRTRHVILAVTHMLPGTPLQANTFLSFSNSLKLPPSLQYPRVQFISPLKQGLTRGTHQEADAV